MWYWKPEQPPPTTATRRATGTGLCMLMISLTLVLATGVKLIINSLGLRSRAHPRSYQLYIIPELSNRCASACSSDSVKRHLPIEYAADLTPVVRSEERRVGKECR